MRDEMNTAVESNRGERKNRQADEELRRRLHVNAPFDFAKINLRLTTYIKMPPDEALSFLS
jgi:hypothetical protein